MLRGRDGSLTQIWEGFRVIGEPVSGLEPLDRAMTRVLMEHDAPGVALAVMRQGRLIYARGFGWADLQAMEPVQPTALFRIASISKPVTAVAILRLIEEGRLDLDDKIFQILPFDPYLEPGAEPDPRTHEITVRHCLNHTGGWDRAKSGDMMFSAAEIAQALGVPAPAEPETIIRWACGRPLDFTPGQSYAYSNYGYCLLGRVIETLTGRPYDEYVKAEILAPMGITTMRIGRTLLSGRAPNEVVYYPLTLFARSVFQETLGLHVPHPYGAWYLEAMDSHGGWIASAVDIARFASAFHDFDGSPVLTRASIETMFSRPPGPVGLDEQGRPKESYYGLGWSVNLPKGDAPGHQQHNGMLHGTATVMRRRDDGICWAALFNRAIGRKEAYIGDAVSPLMNQALARITDWPEEEIAV
jgi:N-acyl-D-amino-acid deacylase